MVAESEIEGVYGLPLDIHALLEKFQCIVKAAKCRRGDDDILQTSSLNYIFQFVKKSMKVSMSMKSKQKSSRWG